MNIENIYGIKSKETQKKPKKAYKIWTTFYILIRPKLI
jgi:hypothetical protein